MRLEPVFLISMKKEKKEKREKKQKKQKCQRTSIGGQAVMEGVMMRGVSSMATAVRDADGIIRIESKRVKPYGQRNRFLRLPIVRGCVAFFDSFVSGTKILTRSAEVYGEGEPSRFEKWMAEKLKINLMSVIIAISMLLGIGLAVLFFVLGPIWLRKGIEWIVSAAQGSAYSFNVVAKNFIEGGFKILIFVLYIVLTSLIKDVRRTYQYHGAEHKTISCYEAGLELTPENAKKCSRVHNRCGTTFMVFVLVISILTFACAEALFNHFDLQIEGIWRVLLKIAFLPLVAGLSYELLKGLAKTDCWVFYPLKAPGLLLQRITTKEPDEGMLEVAIAAFNKVMEMDADPSVPEQKFVVAMKRSQLFDEVKTVLIRGGVEETSDAEWIVALSLGVKRDEVRSDQLVTPKYVEKAMRLAKERATGRPLWYCVGNADFYGYPIKVDERVLIPRPETEELVERALKEIDKESRVLDLCTGSGAIAVAVFLKTGAQVAASDVSADALALARENAAANRAEVEFIESDLFENLQDRVFDAILTNPPYIRSGDIPGLQREVSAFEPRLALDGGEDGLACYRRIAETAGEHLAPGGFLLAECGYDQADAVAELFSAIGRTEVFSDLSGIRRMVKVVKDV